MPSFDAGQTGITPGVTILNTDGTTHTAHTTAGFTEPVTGSHIYRFAHPAPGTLLEFIFDALIGGVTYYASVWDDGLTPQAAAQAAIVAEAVSTFNATTDPVEVGNIDDVQAGIATASALAEVDTVVDGIASSVAALPDAPVGTLITHASTDVGDVVLGLATPGSSITAYLASDTGRTEPKRHTTAATDGTWALYLPAGTYVLVVSLDGYYDAADGDSVIERTVVVS